MSPHELLEFSTRRAGFAHTPADSCVVFDSARPLRKVMASINATTGDLLLAKQLGCDGFLLHHPLAGSARRHFHLVLDRMVELMAHEGVPAWRGREATADLARRLQYADHSSDWDHLASAARLIGISLVNVHLAADELGRRRMVAALATLGPDATLSDAAQALRTIPELAHPANQILFLPDDPARRAGRIAVMHAGGTNGGSSVARCLFEHAADARGAVDTVLYIHLAGDDAKALEARALEGHHGNLIITGHLASDAVGMNELMLALHRERGIEFVAHGGLGTFSGDDASP